MKIPRKDLIKISMKTNGRCFYCNKPGEVIDHFVSRKKWQEWSLEETPLKGKLNSLENLFLACRKCNSLKKDKCPEDFIGNDFKAWSRYSRANKRAGIDVGCGIDNLYGFGGITPSWVLKNIDWLLEVFEVLEELEKIGVVNKQDKYGETNN